MNSSLSEQLKFLINENKGVKLENILEKVLESDIYFFNDILNHPNVLDVLNDIIFILTTIKIILLLIKLYYYYN
jgi:hypothetical protein